MLGNAKKVEIAKVFFCLHFTFIHKRISKILRNFELKIPTQFKICKKIGICSKKRYNADLMCNYDEIQGNYFRGPRVCKKLHNSKNIIKEEYYK